VNLRQKIQASCDRAIAALIALLVLGSVLGFGGAVWWFRPFLVAATLLLVMAGLARHLAAGRMPLLKSPLGLLGLLALALGVVQLAPLPARLAQRLSPSAHEIYARGMFAARAHADDPEAALPEAPEIRSPASLDRSATLRWLVVAAACLGIFWAVSHYADRLERLYLVWGLVVAGFLLNASLAIVQITNRSDGLYGLFVPGAGPAFTPTLNDLLEAPGTAALRDLPPPGSGPAAPDRAAPVPGAVLTPTAPFLFGTMVSSPGAFLAFGTLAMPLAMAIVLHLVSPRGSREGLSDRLGQSGQGSLVLLLAVLMAIGAFLIGLVAGPWYGLPLVAGVAAVGLPALVSPGARWPAFGLTTLVLAGLGLGVAMEAAWPVLLKGPSPVHLPDPETARSLWAEGLEIFREFPLVGSGLGTFPSIHAYFKDRDLTSTTAMSSLVLWGVEAGAVGLGLLALAGLWCLARLPGGLKRVGSIDRSLAFGLIGAVLGFSLLAVVHWTVELSAVAVSASALGGTWNRWLAGGTDLFVERG
jgi:hypothetical protein